MEVSGRNRFFPEVCTQAIVEFLLYISKDLFNLSVLPLLTPFLSLDPTEFTADNLFLWAKLIDLYSVCNLSLPLIIFSLILVSILLIWMPISLAQAI